LNKFNTRNLLNFFSERSNAYLFIHYFELSGDTDAKSQNDVEYSKLQGEMEALYGEADKYVKLQLENFQQSKRREEEKPDFQMHQEDFSFFDISI